MKKVLLGVLAAIVLLVLCWKNLFLYGWIPLDGNVIRYAYPRWTLFHAALHSPGLMLWNPFYNMGEPLLADPQSMAAYPITWLLAPISSYLHFMQSWIVIHTLGAAAAMGLWAWRRHRDLWAAAAAGVFVALNGFMLSRGNLPNHFASAAWLPVILYALDRGSPAGLGIALALQWTAGFPPFSCLSVLCVLAVALWKGRAAQRCAAIGGLIALGLSAYQWLPFHEMLNQSSRALWLPADVAAQCSVPLRQLLKELLLPQWYAFRPGVLGDSAIVSFYAGPIALALAAYAVYRGRRAERWLAGAIGITLLFTLGSFLPGYSVLTPLHLFRFPANWLLVAMIGVAWLCGEGVHRLEKDRRKKIALALVAGDLLLFAQYTRTAWTDASFLTQTPLLAQTIQASPIPGRIYHSIAMELAWTAQTATTPEAIGLLKDFLIPSYGTAFAIPEARSYQILRNRRAQAFQNRLEGAPRSSPLWNRAGISIVIGSTPGASRIDRDHMVVWQNKHPNPLLTIVPGALGTVAPILIQADQVEAKVDLRQPGIVALREVSYPGWKASVDGAEVPLQLFEDTFMAVPVGAGQHTVSFKYYSDSFRVGVLLSLLTGLGLLGFLGIRTYRRTAR